MRRRGSLLRSVGRTAAIAGTATAVSGRVARRQDRTFATEQAATRGTGSAAAAARPDESPREGDIVSALERLAALHTAGELSDGEFSSAKARILT